MQRLDKRKIQWHYGAVEGDKQGQMVGRLYRKLYYNVHGRRFGQIRQSGLISGNIAVSPYGGAQAPLFIER